jgi:lipopolysaccharide export LptBFGC system permease protein LptF
MSFDVRDKLILTIICSIVGFIFTMLIISLLFWLIIQHYRSKARRMNSNEENNSPSYQRQQYQRSQKYISNKSNVNNNNNKKKLKKRRFNTTDSAVTLSFNPPHLINQNVKNLEKLLHNESTLTANSWHYEETFPTQNW